MSSTTTTTRDGGLLAWARWLIGAVIVIALFICAIVFLLPSVTNKVSGVVQAADKTANLQIQVDKIQADVQNNTADVKNLKNNVSDLNDQVTSLHGGMDKVLSATDSISKSVAMIGVTPTATPDPCRTITIANMTPAQLAGCQSLAAITNVATGKISVDGTVTTTQTTTQQVGDPSVAYNTPPQPQIAHPSVYLETGVPCLDGMGCSSVDAHTKHWKMPLLDGTTAIVSGFTVDGVSQGVLKAQVGPGTLDTTVTDGFISIVVTPWAENEFCFRLGQMIEKNWAHSHVMKTTWACAAK